jgi:hypothetical protein
MRKSERVDLRFAGIADFKARGTGAIRPAGELAEPGVDVREDKAA